MAKESGLGWTDFKIDDDGSVVRDIVNDVLNADWDHPRETVDVTGLNVSSHERLLGLGDFTVNLVTAFNDASNQSYDVFKNAGTTNVTRTILTEISSQKLTNECHLTSVVLARAEDTSLQFAVTAVLSNGIDATWST